MGLWRNIAGYAGNMVELFLPRSCAVCGEKLVSGESFICTECRTRFPYTYFSPERFNPMAERFNAQIQRHLDAAAEAGTPVPWHEPYACCTALYFYKGDYRRLSQALKYDANLPLGRYLAQALGRHIAQSPLFGTVDAVVPVPLHWRRRLARGYNQAGVIAEELSRSIGAVCRPDILVRSRHTGTQTRLDRAAKAANVNGAFSVRGDRLDFMQCAPAASVGTGPGLPRHILLVDDVFTTGATLSECHFALRSALVSKYGPEAGSSILISAATLAFVGE